MYQVYFDSGTTNTRAYVIKDKQVVASGKKAIGSKDSSISGNKATLVGGIKELYDRVLQENSLTDSDIAEIYASGMITSPFGMKEVPHLTVPVSLDALRRQVYTYYEPDFFRRDVKLIRGIKTIPDGFTVDRQNMIDVNNMRGEEIEIFGMLADLPAERCNRPTAVFMPGSHTHVVFVKDGALQDILSNFGGELFGALASSTILSNSIDLGIETVDEGMVMLGYEKLAEYGFNRALYLVNTMQIFGVLTKRERTSYLEGVIVGGVMMAFEKTVSEKWKDVKELIVAGSGAMADACHILLKALYKDMNVNAMSAEGQGGYAVRGFFALQEQGGSRCREKC